jgi:hypothetical protein
MLDHERHDNIPRRCKKNFYANIAGMNSARAASQFGVHDVPIGTTVKSL